MHAATGEPVIDARMRLTGVAITVVTAPSRAIQRAFRRLYDGTPETGKKLGNDVVTEVEVPVDTTLGPSMLFDEQPSRRADELFRQILSRALENHCSDIHLEMLPSGLHVRHRVDGVLRQPHFGSLQDSLDHNMREIMSRIKILATLDIAERRRPQDGSFQVTVERAGSTVTIDLRVSVIPSYSGESVAIRILDRTRAPRSITELDLSPTVSPPRSAAPAHHGHLPGDRP